MDASLSSISPQTLIAQIGTPHCPGLFDVRRAEIFAAADWILPTALWRGHKESAQWGAALDRAAEAVVYCVHGHQVSQSAAALLRSVGLSARYLEGGIEAYAAAGGPLLRKKALPVERPSRWVTRARPKIDRIACPWLVRRFVDRQAVIHFVAADWVEATALELDAHPFDVPGVAFSHQDERCSFDAFLDHFGLADPALDRLAEIVRAADTGRLDSAAQAPGLLAISLGLSALWRDDQVMLEQGLPIYDALYGWCRHASQETHGWPPALTQRHDSRPGQ